MSEATSEHSAQPVTAHSGWRHLQGVLSRTVPRRLTRAQQARRGIRALRARR
jgi:hypothetical protein